MRTATALDHCKIRIAQRVVADQCGLVGRSASSSETCALVKTRRLGIGQFPFVGARRSSTNRGEARKRP